MRTLLLCWLLAPLALAQERDPLPQDHERVTGDVAALVSRIDLDRGAGVAYTGTLSAVNFIRGHAVIFTVGCEELPAYGGQFFTWSEVSGRAVGELIVGAGEEGVRVMKGQELEEYLARVKLDPTPLREVFRRHYAPKKRE